MLNCIYLSSLASFMNRGQQISGGNLSAKNLSAISFTPRGRNYPPMCRNGYPSPYTDTES